MNQDTTKAIAGLLGVANLYSIAYIYQAWTFTQAQIIFTLVTGLLSYLFFNKAHKMEVEEDNQRPN